MAVKNGAKLSALGSRPLASHEYAMRMKKEIRRVQTTAVKARTTSHFSPAQRDLAAKIFWVENILDTFELIDIFDGAIKIYIFFLYYLGGGDIYRDKNMYPTRCIYQNQSNCFWYISILIFRIRTTFLLLNFIWFMNLKK